MAQIYPRTKILGVAMVVDNGDGTRTLYGLDRVHEATFSVRDDWETGRSFFLDVQASAGFIRHAGTGFQAPAQLPSGIYLPGMQFHALPEPGGEA